MWHLPQQFRPWPHHHAPSAASWVAFIFAGNLDHGFPERVWALGKPAGPRPGAWDHRSGVRGGGCRQSQLVCIRGRGLQTHTDSSTGRVGSTASHRAVKTQHFQTPGQTRRTLWFKHTFRGHHLA